MRALLATALAGAVVAAVFAVPTAVKAAQDTGAQPTAASQDASAQGSVGFRSRHWDRTDGSSGHRAYVSIEVFSGGRKHIHVCDLDSRDPYGLAIQMDPSGPQVPITYWDRNYEGHHCADYDMGYKVRKWRFVSVHQSGGALHGVRPWQVYPLPRPDF